MEIVTNLKQGESKRKTNSLKNVADQYHALITKVEDYLSLLIPGSVNNKIFRYDPDLIRSDLKHKAGLETIAIYK